MDHSAWKKLKIWWKKYHTAIESRMHAYILVSIQVIENKGKKRLNRFFMGIAIIKKSVHSESKTKKKSGVIPFEYNRQHTSNNSVPIFIFEQKQMETMLSLVVEFIWNRNKNKIQNFVTFR